MSLIDDITGAVGYRAPGAMQPTNGTGQQPGGPNAAERLQSRFTGVFQTTFNSTMATVFERGVAGEFDDPTLRLQEQAALERLRLAQQQAARTTTSTGSAGGPTAGANAAPDADGDLASRATSNVAVDEQRELYALRVRQSEARLANISTTLSRDFPKAAQLSSASTGTWDPTTFEPKSRDEVEAFAHRMVIDATESAARLEIVKTQLDAARFDAQNGGGAAAQQKVATLESDYARQKAYVDKLTKIVDEQSNGQVTDAGGEALAGRTLRDLGDIPVAELAAELRASGMSEEQVKRVIGATELGVEQEKTPGGSPRLKKIAADMTTAMLAHFNRVHERHREEFQRQEQERADNARQVDKRVENQRRDERASAKAQERRVESRQAQEQRVAERTAEFEQWLATLAAAGEQERRAS